MIKLYKSVVLTFATALCFVGFGQQYANKEWVRSSPVTGSGIYHTSTIVYSGKLYVTGNKLNGSGNTDIFTMKLDTNGDTLWSVTYNGSATGSMDYGIELKSSSDGYIYVVGAAQNSSTGYDYCILKYNSSTGSQVWVRNWNGVGNGDDIPSAMLVDGSSAIYITGGSEATNGFSDYGTIKISNLNVLNWAKYYDYNHLHDGATTITKKLGQIVVSGGSAAAVGDWDLATVPYNILSGSQGTATRSNITGATMVEASAMITDSQNNIYITGYADISGDKNMETVKLDSNLTLQWIAHQGTGNSLDDIGYDIGLDAAGNVYVTGSSEYSSSKQQAITVKYEPDGDTVWTKLYGDVYSYDGMTAKEMCVQPNGDVYITGPIYNGGVQSFGFLKYNQYGHQKIARTFEADSLIDEDFDIQVDGNEVYITTFQETISGTTMTTVKYSLHEKDSSVYTDPNTGKGVYAERDLIVKVDTSLIDFTQINDLGKEFWSLDEIFDPTFVTAVERELETVCGDEHCPITVYRIFRRMQTTDTLSITRLGDTIHVPTFWSTFVFEFPDGVDITDASNEIVGLFPDIKYSTYNLIGYLNDVPDDPEYFNGQISLHDDLSPQPGWGTIHINAEHAWDYETGKRHIKIGVFDGPVQWDHEDFGGSVAAKVMGWSFEVGHEGDIHTATTDYLKNHGTSVAGIIGAIRNNDTGIAGVAGGSYANGFDIDSSGCAIYGMNILSFEMDYIYLNHVADAVYCSSIDNDSVPYSYGLHIMNNSWGISEEAVMGQTSPWYIDTNIVLLREAYHFANRNQVVVVASRGNSGQFQDSTGSHQNTPAVLDPDWILCVGGLGTDGNYHDGDTASAFEYGWSTSYGPEVDVSCYSSGSHNFTMIDSNQYSNFNGTSAAAPHVSGTAGLLLSYINSPLASYNNLAPEDVEEILQMTAIDVNVSTHPGPDTLNGYGLVNAGAAMDQIKKDRYTVAHFGTDMFPDFTDFVQYEIDDTVTLSERYENADGDWFLPNVPYIVDTYKIISQSGHQIFTNEVVVAQWPRHSSSNVFAHFDTTTNVLIPRERVSLDSIDNIWGYLSGYIYKVSDTLGNLIGWIPFDTTNVFDLTYTLLKYDTAYYLHYPEELENFEMNVYPNPTNDSQTLVINFDQPIDGSIRLMDIEGRIVLEIYQGHFDKGRLTYTVDMSNLPKGVYVYSLTFSDGRTYHVKAIKQ